MYLQKIISTFYPLLRYFLSLPIVKRFVRRTFILGSFLSMSIYLWVRLLFHDIPFEFVQEAGMILHLLVTGWCLVGLSIGSFNLLMFAADYYTASRKKRQPAIRSVLLAKFEQPRISLPEYHLISNTDNFAIDKTGRLRYRIKIVKPLQKKRLTGSHNKYAIRKADSAI